MSTIIGDRNLPKRLPRYERVERLLHGACIAAARPALSLPTYRIELFCSAYGGSSSVICERDGYTLRMIRNEQRVADVTFPDATPATALGRFEFDSSQWPGCPRCGAKHSAVHGLGPLWWCACAECKGHLFHCVGSAEPDGRLLAACGRLVAGPFALQQFITVRGWSGVPPAENAALLETIHQKAR